VAETAERVVVMYAGQVVEENRAEALFRQPHMPYTAALLDAMPERSLGKDRLPTIRGVVPGLYDRPTGCLFNPRCRFADDHCRAVQPGLDQPEGIKARCHYPLGTSRSKA
jgi:dipeptide transport system ATP-binding protein